MLLVLYKSYSKPTMQKTYKSETEWHAPNSNGLEHIAREPILRYKHRSYSAMLLHTMHFNVCVPVFV